MDSKLTETAVTVLSDILERFGFLFADFAEKREIRPPEKDSARAEMTFSGAMNGNLALLVTDELAHELTANVMGLEPDDETIPGRVDDTVKELLNLICGHMITELAGEEQVFDLSIPEVSRVSADAWLATLGRSQTVCLQVEDRPILLEIQIEDLRL